MRIPEFFRRRLEKMAEHHMATHVNAEGKIGPDFIIRPLGMDQTLRWWIIPRNRFFNIYLHKFVQSDDDRALHDHPWANCSILVKGQYTEWVKRGFRGSINGQFYESKNRPYRRRQGHVYFRRPKTAHRVELRKSISNGEIGLKEIRIIAPINWEEKEWEKPMPLPVITLFITGPKVREWGFLCPRGWTHWQDFCDKRDHGVIGRGCE